MATQDSAYNTVPNWWLGIDKYLKARISMAFVLHGNIADYVLCGKEYIDLKDFIIERFSDNELIVFYNISEGIRFSNPEMENIFRKCIGWENKKSSKSSQSSMIESLSSKAKTQSFPKEPADIFPLLEKAFKDTGLVLMIEYPEMLFGAQDLAGSFSERANLVTLLRWAKDSEILKNEQNALFLVASNLGELPKSLCLADSNFIQVAIPKPNFEERMKFIDYYTKDKKGLLEEDQSILGSDVIQFEDYEFDKDPCKETDIVKKMSQADEIVVPKCGLTTLEQDTKWLESFAKGEI